MSASLKFVGELPPGEWRTEKFGGLLVLACPDHPPMVVKDGKLTSLDFTPAQLPACRARL